MGLASALLLLVFLGSFIYCILTVIAAHSYVKVRAPKLREAVPISILKPVHGLEPQLEENLRCWFRQEYSDFEIVFAAQDENDAAIPVVEKLRKEFPHIPSRLIVTGEPPFHNAKVFSLQRLTAEARHDLLVMTDSDVYTESGMLRCVAAEFQDPRLGLATCPYCCVPGKGFWPTLAALGMNTEFLEGVLVARLVEGMRFALGPAIVARRQAIERIGGFERLGSYLAEDFVLGKFVAESGFEVILSSWVVEHRVGTESFRQAAAQRLRWSRSTRRSRPLGYLGQFFTNPVPLALMVWPLHPAWWPFVLFVVLFRTGTAGAVTEWVLRDPLTRKYWWLIPAHDIAGFLIWLAGFFGNTIRWRSRQYYLYRDGTIDLIDQM